MINQKVPGNELKEEFYKKPKRKGSTTIGTLTN